jgi:ABC-type sugar transport system ATPase subunit
VYVTHDQEEAMTLGSRVAVMRDGFLQQVAPPMELYRNPANQFVAGFVGSPAMNFLPRDEVPRALTSSGATLGIRPHDITIVAAGAGDEDAWVELVESRGSELLVYLCLRGNNQGPAIRVVAPPETSVQPDRMVGLRFDRERLHWFDEKCRRVIAADERR